MRITLDAAAFAAGIKAACAAETARTAAAITAAVEEATDGLKEELRDQTFTKLGVNVAYTWQGRIYPPDKTSLSPAGFVWTKAPRIIDFWTASRIRTPLGGAFAIPTKNVPKGNRGKRLSPVEVEARFNQELKAMSLRSGNIGLFLDLVRAKSRRRPGWREATKSRLGDGREADRLLMFVLVRTVSSRKLIDLEGPARRWAARVPALFEARMGAGR